MHVAQSGIFALGTGSHSYLEFDLLEHADPLTLVQVMANLGEPRMTTGGVNLVVGFKPSLWARVAPEEMPAEVSDFELDVRGVDGYTMPATQHDLWLWVAGHAYHTVFDVTREAVAALAPIARLATEVAGWTYKESRDLTGFIDGTENRVSPRHPRWRSFLTSLLERVAAWCWCSSGCTMPPLSMRFRLRSKKRSSDAPSRRVLS